MGACRADERLNPLLKLNNAIGAAEDRLLAHLSQVRMRTIEIRCLRMDLVRKKMILF